MILQSVSIVSYLKGLENRMRSDPPGNSLKTPRIQARASLQPGNDLEKAWDDDKMGVLRIVIIVFPGS